MQVNQWSGYVGVFDSGVGGISVLRNLVRELPAENFLYYGDSAHAPYGDKTIVEVRSLSANIVETMLARGVKAIVIACNTATSAAAEHLRECYPGLPIIGMEPALKPAAINPQHQNILVMATTVTLKLDKFQQLAHTWGSQSHIIALPCPGLADLVETGDLDSDAIRSYLAEKLAPYRGQVDSVVLGCTHYPYLKRQIHQVLGAEVPLFDGGAGCARQTRRLLSETHLLANTPQTGRVIFETSSADTQTLKLYERLFSIPLSTEQ